MSCYRRGDSAQLGGSVRGRTIDGVTLCDQREDCTYRAANNVHLRSYEKV